MASPGQPSLVKESVVDVPAIDLERLEFAIDLDRFAELATGHARTGVALDIILHDVVAEEVEDGAEHDDHDDDSQREATDPLPPAGAGGGRDGRGGFVGHFLEWWFVQREVAGGGGEQNPERNPNPDQTADADSERDGCARGAARCRT